jgi:hypothetical protein
VKCPMSVEVLLKRHVQTIQETGIVKETCSGCSQQRYHYAVEMLLMCKSDLAFES